MAPKWNAQMNDNRKKSNEELTQYQPWLYGHRDHMYGAWFGFECLLMLKSHNLFSNGVSNCGPNFVQFLFGGSQTKAIICCPFLSFFFLFVSCKWIRRFNRIILRETKAAAAFISITALEIQFAMYCHITTNRNRDERKSERSRHQFNSVYK